LLIPTRRIFPVCFLTDLFSHGAIPMIIKGTAGTPRPCLTTL
jgi:hypothetical protein